jgi:hypothetical protein
MVTEVPPAIVPELGETLVMVGGGVPYVKPATNVANWSSGLVTRTSTTPAAWGGVTAPSCVALVTVTDAAATPPKDTVAPARKFVPHTVTSVPPASGPLVGRRLMVVGAGTG